LNNVICGTNITVTQEGIPSAIPVEMCYLGWQESLDKLQALVERHVPDA
ncbi:MAG: SRPBCC domain-containing protein, partial [Bacteroidia bacterium]